MICYTDGSCLSNGTEFAQGGFGVVVLDDQEHLLTTYAKHNKNTTNNREELRAILWVLINYGHINPIVYSDSTYCVNTLTNWMFGWAQRGWVKSDNKTPENLDLIKAFYDLWAQGKRIQLRKVPGHVGIKWNEMADALATGKLRGEKGLYEEE